MKVKERRKSIALEDGRRLDMTYILSAETSPEFGCDTYSVSVTTENTDETVTVHDVTPNKDEAEKIFSAIVRGRVTAVTLRYIIEDFLS